MMETIQGSVPVPDPTTLTNQLVEAAVTAAVERLEARLHGTDELNIEKFSNIGTRFNELNARLTESDRYKQTALDAALLANKDSLRKTEELFSKQIDALQKTVDDLKGSVRQSAGAHIQGTETLAWVIAACGAVAAIALVVVDLVHH